MNAQTLKNLHAAIIGAGDGPPPGRQRLPLDAALHDEDSLWNC